MATKKSKGLGMGLEALLGPKLTDAQDAAQTDPADQPGTLAPRCGSNTTSCSLASLRSASRMPWRVA